jgi:cell division protein FtsQ
MNRIGLWITLALFAVAVAASAWWLTEGHDERDWPVRWLEVEGDLERITSAQVRAAVADHAARGFFRIDIEGARAAVEALPWVAAATVSRRWPDALVIELVEQRAVARFNDSALISREGELFSVAGTGGMQGLARLQGPEARAREMFERWLALRALLQPADLDIAVLALDPRGAWRIELTDGRDLLLGREQLEHRLARFLAVRGELARFDDIRTIDLRYPNGLALVRAGVDDEEAAEAARLADRTPTPGAQPNHG